MHERILLIEDEESTILIVSAALKPLCETEVARTAADAESRLAKDDYELVVLDIGLPDGDGFQLCEKIRANPRTADVPIFFLTSRDKSEDMIRAFALGADDYLIKPVDPAALSARVARKLKRRKETLKTTILERAGFRADLNVQRMFRKEENGTETELLLTPIEFRLMVHFLRNEGTVVSRKSLVETVWGPTTHVADHTIESHISSLRKKIGRAAESLRSVLKQGYCFTPAKVSKQES